MERALTASERTNLSRSIVPRSRSEGMHRSWRSPRSSKPRPGTADIPPHYASQGGTQDVPSVGASPSPSPASLICQPCGGGDCIASGNECGCFPVAARLPNKDRSCLQMDARGIRESRRRWIERSSSPAPLVRCCFARRSISG
ncbi:hypothetical protein MRX96_019248 [Rhipicephalus microplus]